MNCRLLWHGHQVMYRQLSTWMVYGLLQDQHQEFFVRRFVFVFNLTLSQGHSGRACGILFITSVQYMMDHDSPPNLIF